MKGLIPCAINKVRISGRNLVTLSQAFIERGYVDNTELRIVQETSRKNITVRNLMFSRQWRF